MAQAPPARPTAKRIFGALCASLLAIALAAPAARAQAPTHPFLFSLTGTKRVQVGETPPFFNFSPDERFEDACGVAVDSHGDIYIADYYHDAVDVYDSSGYFMTQIKAEDPIDGPCGLAVDSAGDVFVDNWREDVAEFTPSSYPPVLATTYSTGTVIDPGRATGLALDSQGDLYVDNRTYVARYEAPVHSGEAPVEIGLGTLGTAPGSGYGVAVSAYPATEGDVYVPDAATATVKVYDPAGDALAPIDGAGTPQGGFHSLLDSSVAVDLTDGHLYVADDLQGPFEHPAAVVDEFNSSGRYRGQIPQALTDAEPSGLAVDGTGNVYVSAGNSEEAALYAFGPTVPAHALALAKTGTGEGAVASAPAGIDCGAACAAEYNVGESVTLTATPSPHSAFSGWSGGGCSGTGACHVTLGADTEVSAEFAAIPQQTLQVSLAGSGEGTVKSEPAGIACSAGACSAHFDQGSTATLTATPAPHNRLLGWSGCSSEPSPTQCEVTMSAAESVSAAFAAIPQQTLDVSVTGSGEVTSSAPGIACSAGAGACSAHFDQGSTATLTATPAPHNRLLGWSGCSSEPSPTQCEVTMNAAESVAASFVSITHDLQISVSGGGSISASSGAISDCTSAAGVCSGSYGEGSTVTLTATPDPNQAFTGFTGGGCAGARACEVTIGEDTEVIARFRPIQRTLAVAASGAGFGTVTSEPAGIDCGTACAEVYDQGAVLTVTATPAPGSTFSGWSGCDSAAANRCTVALSADRTVVPLFDPEGSLKLTDLVVKGTAATLRATVSGPGTLSASGKGLRASHLLALAAGRQTLRLALSGAGRRALREARRRELEVRVNIAFAPSGGGAPLRATTGVTFRAKGRGR